MSEPRRYCIREGKGCGDAHCSRNPGMTTCPFEYDEAKGDPEHNYRGSKWPPPPMWEAADGTIVYRTYADYVDD